MQSVYPGRGIKGAEPRVTGGHADCRNPTAASDGVRVGDIPEWKEGEGGMGGHGRPVSAFRGPHAETFFSATMTHVCFFEELIRQAPLTFIRAWYGTTPAELLAVQRYTPPSRT